MEQAAPTLEGQGREVVDAIFSLLAYQERLPWTGEELAEKTAKSTTLAIPDEKREALADRIAAWMLADAVALAAKATDVISEQERLFTSARILTDLRPVFAEAAEDPPLGVGIVETLKIDYLDAEGSDASFYVALDTGDIADLKEVIDRAIAKTESLKQWIGSAGMAYWGYEEDENAGIG